MATLLRRARVGSAFITEPAVQLLFVAGVRMSNHWEVKAPPSSPPSSPACRPAPQKEGDVSVGDATPQNPIMLSSKFKENNAYLVTRSASGSAVSACGSQGRPPGGHGCVGWPTRKAPEPRALQSVNVRKAPLTGSVESLTATYFIRWPFLFFIGCTALACAGSPCPGGPPGHRSRLGCRMVSRVSLTQSITARPTTPRASLLHFYEGSCLLGNGGQTPLLPVSFTALAFFYPGRLSSVLRRPFSTSERRFTYRWIDGSGICWCLRLGCRPTAATAIAIATTTAAATATTLLLPVVLLFFPTGRASYGGSLHHTGLTHGNASLRAGQPGGAGPGWDRLGQADLG